MITIIVHYHHALPSLSSSLLSWFVNGLPKTFWADTVSTATYLINRGPSVPMEFRLPEEVWSGKEVKFSYLKVFGCVSYVHIDSDARSKLDAKSKICFFIGYGDEKFGYRF